MTRIHFAKAGAAAALAIMLTGCWATKPAGSWKFQVEAGAVKEGPPKASGEAIKTVEAMSSHPQIKIEPEAAAGYGELPENVRQLFGPQPMQVGLLDVVRQTMDHSRDIKIQGYSLQIAEQQIPVSKSVYDLTVQAKYQFAMEKDPTTTAFSSIGAQRTRDGSVTVGQLLPTGARLQAGYTYNRTAQMSMFSLISPLITNGFNVSLIQPLLQGFGPGVTNADIHIAQADLKASAAQFETQVQTQLQQALELYWDLIKAVQSHQVQLVSYTAALDLLRVNRAKEKAGVIAPTEVLQAQARSEQRRDLLIRARQAVRDVEDRLKQQMFFQDGSPAWKQELYPTQELAWREYEFDPDKALAEGLARRPELRARQARIERRELEIVKTKDLLKPQVNIVGSYAVTGAGGDYGPSFDQLETYDFNRYAVGVEFSHTLQNRRGRYLHQQSLAAREQAGEEYQADLDRVTFEIRQAVRQLQAARERIEVSRSSVESNQANLDAERKRYEVGVSTSFQVLEFQEFLAQAQESYVLAVVDYNKAAIDLERAKGSILATYGVKVDSPEMDPNPAKVIFPVGLN